MGRHSAGRVMAEPPGAAVSATTEALEPTPQLANATRSTTTSRRRQAGYDAESDATQPHTTLTSNAITPISNQRGASRMRGSSLALVVAALVVALWLCAAPVSGRAMLLPLPRDAARLAAAAAAAAAEAEYDAVAGAANWPDDDPPPPGLSQEEQRQLLRMLLLRMVQERGHGHGHGQERGHERGGQGQGEHDAAIDAALAAAGPLLQPPGGAGDDDADIDGDADADGALSYGGPHAPDDKRNLQGMMPTLCHFKICHMGRKRNQQKAAARAAH